MCQESAYSKKRVYPVVDLILIAAPPPGARIWRTVRKSARRVLIGAGGETHERSGDAAQRCPIESARHRRADKAARDAKRPKNGTSARQERPTLLIVRNRAVGMDEKCYAGFVGRPGSRSRRNSAAPKVHRRLESLNTMLDSTCCGKSSTKRLPFFRKILKSLGQAARLTVSLYT